MAYFIAQGVFFHYRLSQISTGINNVLLHFLLNCAQSGRNYDLMGMSQKIPGRIGQHSIKKCGKITFR
jgi:hypothetical protein